MKKFYKRGARHLKWNKNACLAIVTVARNAEEQYEQYIYR